MIEFPIPPAPSNTQGGGSGCSRRAPSRACSLLVQPALKDINTHCLLIDHSARCVCTRAWVGRLTGQLGALHSGMSTCGWLPERDLRLVALCKWVKRFHVNPTAFLNHFSLEPSSPVGLDNHR